MLPRSRRNPAQTTLNVRLTPHAARGQVVGWSDDVLRLRVCAPPLAKVLATALSIPAGRIAVVRGLRDRNKQVVVEGLTRAQIRERIDAASSG